MHIAKNARCTRHPAVLRTMQTTWGLVAGSVVLREGMCVLVASIGLPMLT